MGLPIEDEVVEDQPLEELPGDEDDVGNRAQFEQFTLADVADRCQRRLRTTERIGRHKDQRVDAARLAKHRQHPADTVGMTRVRTP